MAKKEEKNHNKIKLRVVEALQDDAYKGVVRIDTKLMKGLDLQRGDIISIKGERETFSIVDRAYPADLGERIIRMDGIARKNAKVGIGEQIEIKKAHVKPAKKITLAPAQQGIMVQGDPDNFKRGLLGKPVSKGDIVVLGGTQRRRDLMSEGFGDFLGGDFEEIFSQMGFGGLPGGLTQIRFAIVSTSPNQPVIITENTEITLSSKAVDISEEAVPQITYEDIGGLREEVKKVREMVELPLKRPEIFSRLGIEPPKGVLLYGPPGTGKTLLAKAVANESESNFIQVKGPSLLSMWVGKSEEGIRKIFERARQVSPCIVFFDEIDSIASKRGQSMGGGSKVTENVLNQLLAEMDGIEDLNNVIVVGATNRPDILDPALLRPGRFDRIVFVPVPEAKGRLQILKIHTKNMPLDKSVDLEKMSEETEGYTGADLEALAKEAAMLALREDKDIKHVTAKHFEKAIDKVQPSVSKNDAERYKQVESKYLKSAKAALANGSASYAG